MLTKNNVKLLLNEMIEQQPEKRKELLLIADRLYTLSDEEFNNILKENNVDNIESAREFVNNNLENRTQTKFIPLNDVVGYGITDSTLHIHVMPKDLSEVLSKTGRKKVNLDLIDALEKIQKIISKEENLNIKEVFAVSGILRGPLAKGFEELGFDTKVLKIKEAKEDKDLSYFYERFKDSKYLGRAVISRDKILSEEWIEHKDKIKVGLQEELGITPEIKPKEKEDFSSKMKDMVKTTEEVSKTDIEYIENSKNNEEKNINRNKDTKDKQIE